jgi:alpha-L-fucosidase
MQNKIIMQNFFRFMKCTLLLVIFVVFSFSSIAQQKTDPSAIAKKMEWFEDAKLGIFIHWGIYAVNGIDESWSFYNKKVTWTDYMKQLSGFTASKYDPAAWADLVKLSGARYAVLTTKHHDGVALWNSAENHYNVVKNTPAKRDLLTPFYQELRKRNIKAGAYFSLIDWSHPDYPGFLKDSSRYKIENDPAKWQRFRQFFQNQINEISTKFNPDLFWFDGDWEHSAAEWESEKVRANILQKNPNAIINGRLMGYGDYETPEQNLPISRPKFNWWELCMTTNNNWGFQHKDTNWKTPYEIISHFADAVSNGGNLLLDIGPREDGTIPKEQVNILTELGKWNKKHEKAIFSSRPGIPMGHFYGPTTMSKDSTSLYLFLQGQTSGTILVKGLVNQIKEINVVGQGSKLKHKVVGKISWSPVPGLVYIDVPPTVLDKYITVLELKLGEAVKLYGDK